VGDLPPISEWSEIPSERPNCRLLATFKPVFLGIRIGGAVRLHGFWARALLQLLLVMPQRMVARHIGNRLILAASVRSARNWSRLCQLRFGGVCRCLSV
jgi:hypothetical protein